MRVSTAGQMKGTTKNSTRDAPREGTKLHAIYTLFLQHRGEWLPGKILGFDIKTRSRTLRDLTDYYGFEIERRGPRCYMEYRLAGEYFGRDYVSYVKEESHA